MRIEQGMVGHVTETGLVSGAVPDRVGALGNHLLEHFESGLIMGIDDLGIGYLAPSSSISI